MYDYKKIYFFENKTTKTAQFSNYDFYKNNYGTLVGKYYMIPRLSSSATFNTFEKYDIDYGTKLHINMIYNISKQSYINGVYDDKLYVFDKSELKQYEIDPYSEEVKVVGDEQNNCFAYINGKKTTVSVYEMNNDEIKFSESKDDYSDVESDKLLVQKGYAIYVQGNNVYKVYSKYQNNPIYLFSAEEIKDIKVKNDNIYYLQGDSVYRYNMYGTVKLVSRNELNYNYENAFDIYFK